MLGNKLKSGVFLLLGLMLCACQSTRAVHKNVQLPPFLLVRGALLMPKHAAISLPVPGSSSMALFHKKIAVLDSAQTGIDIPRTALLVPASTAPVNYLGEDEDLRAQRLASKTYQKPSKKHLF